MKLSKNAQEMGVEAGQIRIPHEILMKNSYFPASVYFARVDLCFAWSNRYAMEKVSIFLGIKDQCPIFLSAQNTNCPVSYNL